MFYFTNYSWHFCLLDLPSGLSGPLQVSSVWQIRFLSCKKQLHSSCSFSYERCSNSFIYSKHFRLRPPAHPFEAILLYDWNQLIIAFHFMYAVGRLQQRTTCVFNQFQIYDHIAEKGCAGGLKAWTALQKNTKSVDWFNLEYICIRWSDSSSCFLGTFIQHFYVF